MYMYNFKKLKQIALFLLIVMLSKGAAFATGGEGMWLPLLLKKYNEAEMKQMGMKISADDIYNVNKACLKDAIVQLGQFCTGEIVSDKGLVFTNHHCGYDAIQSQSSIEHNYLQDGFWAMSNGEELPIEGLSMKILVKMEDVTEKVKKALEGTNPNNPFAVDAALGNIEKEATEGTHYKASVESMFAGNEYYLFLYEEFTDIRLVGAPPSSVGKFGGDTDNWMWPRHTGDFSIFRIYAGKDNKPAVYAKNNVPYKPKKSLKISLKDVEQTDFSMIMGFPGSTTRYLTSSALEFDLNNTNQDYIKLFGKRLEIMKEAMAQDPKVKIALAADYASYANTYKYFVGQTNGLKKDNVINEKKKYEESLQKWIDAKKTRKDEYGTILPDYAKNHTSYQPYSKAFNYLNLAIFAPKVMLRAYHASALKANLEEKDPNKNAIDTEIAKLKAEMKESFEDYNAEVDQELLAEMMLLYYQNVPKDQQPPSIKEIPSKYKTKTLEGSFEKFAETAFKKSVFASEAKYKAFLNKPNAKILAKDPILMIATQAIDEFRQKMAVNYAKFTQTNDYLDTKYQKLMREYQPNKKFYPDANSTLRLTYGKILSYDPRDAVHYKYYTTIDGLMEKYTPGDAEFDLPKKVLELYEKKDYGKYADKNGNLRIAFLSDNDITGGNSGSPVLNANGDLIGIAFDGNWESMTGDLYYEHKVNRTISVDIHYVLWVIEKVGKCNRLISELNIVK